MVAETAVHLARERRTTVVVDASDLPDATRAQLRVHVGSEGAPAIRLAAALTAPRGLRRQAKDRRL